VKRKVFIVTLGCPKNEVDSEVIAGILRREGMEIVLSPEDADLIIVNTCTFIDEAKEESIETILEVGSGKGKAKLLVAGCLAERYGEELLREMPEIDGLVGLRDVARIGAVAQDILGGSPVSDPARWSDENGRGEIRAGGVRKHSVYLKIAEGCDRPCAFCSIPSFRGSLRSRSLDSLLRETALLAERGAREVVLVGQETTAYGRDLGNGTSLATLVDGLSEVPGIRWVRILYAYPTAVDDALIELLAGGRACRYLDMPIQHISDPLLRRMQRGTPARVIRETVEKLRRRVPGITLRTSVMVGFPGEGEEDFDELRRFLEETRFERLGVFRFSPQEGTAAAGLPGAVPEEVAEERRQVLVDLAEETLEENGLAAVGEDREVIVDDTGSDGLWCRTEADAPEIDGAVLLPGAEGKPGDFLDVRIIDSRSSILIGERRT